MSVDMSSWRNAPTRTDGTTVFAIGDVHGCAGQLKELLDEIKLLTSSVEKSALVFLGDLINRGPDSLGALSEWASGKHDCHHNEVHRLFGNHEQLMMIVANQLGSHREAEAKFLEIGGNAILEELRQKTSISSGRLSNEMLHTSVGDRIWRCLQRLKSHVSIGNLVLVHAGVDPVVGVTESLKLSWKTYGERHWAWIKDPFLQHKKGFDGRIIVHGHTPPWSHRVSSGYPDPHTMQHNRLCLDAGSSTTGIVMGAQIEDGRYRLIASSP